MILIDWNLVSFVFPLPQTTMIASVALMVLLATAVNGATTKSVGSSPVAAEEPSPAPTSATAPKATTPKSAISDASLDAALQDSRYLTRQLKCALGEAPCDPVGKRLKSK